VDHEPIWLTHIAGWHTMVPSHWLRWNLWTFCLNGPEQWSSPSSE
jgi:hypothetical protein